MATRASGVRLRRYSSGGSLLGILAISLSIGSAAYLAGKGFAPPPAREQLKAYVPEYNVVEVPVPDSPVQIGTSVRDIRVRMAKFPDHQVPQGTLRSLRGLEESVALVSMPAGLPIMEANLGNPDQVNNPILGRIPQGMRAMTVRVDATSAVEGWARSGSIVDVLLIEKSRTTVVAEQVRVISAERSLSPMEVVKSAGGGNGVPSTVTLLVTQEQCLAINTAVPLGKIAFALRSAKDDDTWRATHFSSDDLAGKKRAQAKAKVGGVVSFGSGADKKQFALVDGDWIPADDLPKGFDLGTTPTSVRVAAATGAQVTSLYAAGGEANDD
jgi:pilus assembly protein CpaB